METTLGKPEKRRSHAKVNYRLLAGFKQDVKLPLQKTCLNNKGTEGDLLETCLSRSGIKSKRRKCKVSKKNTSESTSLESNSKENLSIHKLIMKNEDNFKLVSCNSDSDNDMDHEPNEKTIFVCKTLDDVDQLPSKTSSNRQFECDICLRKFSTLSNLRTHKTRHKVKSSLPFACYECNFRAATKIEVIRHMTKHSDETLHCPYCYKQFHRYTSVGSHIERCHTIQVNTLECGMCGLRTYKPSHMRSHISSHNGPQFRCPVCGEFFKSKSNLKAHLRNHAGSKPFGCDQCKKNFTRSNDVAAHIRHVHNPSSFHCGYCKKSFPNIHNLKRHVRIHTKEKPFSCCFCKFACNAHGNLLKHIRSIHRKLDFTYKDVLKMKDGYSNPKEQVSVPRLLSIYQNGQSVAEEVLKSIADREGDQLNVSDLKKQFQEQKRKKMEAFSSKRQLAKRCKETGKSSSKRKIKRKTENGVFSKPGLMYFSPDFCISVENSSQQTNCNLETLAVAEYADNSAENGIEPVHLSEQSSSSFINVEDLNDKMYADSTIKGIESFCDPVVIRMEQNQCRNEPFNLYEDPTKDQYAVFNYFGDSKEPVSSKASFCYTGNADIQPSLEKRNVTLDSVSCSLSFLPDKVLIKIASGSHRSEFEKETDLLTNPVVLYINENSFAV